MNRIKKFVYLIEKNRHLIIVRRALTMLIPVLIVGATACTLQNLAIPGYQEFLSEEGAVLKHFLSIVYQGTFGIFSLELLLATAISYANENKVGYDTIGMQVLAVLCAYATILCLGGVGFSSDSVGTTGCFVAMVVGICASSVYSFFNRRTPNVLKKLTVGVNGICAKAIQALYPVLITVSIFAGIGIVLYAFFGVSDVQVLISKGIAKVFLLTNSNFISGILYTFFVHALWFLGVHGSHVLESVAVSEFTAGHGTVFSKSMFDVFVNMGGCGTTVCALLVILLFLRKKHIFNIGKLALPSVVFNVNEVLNYGIPIMLNPSLLVPFMVTPMVCYLISYGAIYIGLVPMVEREISWTTPVFISGYLSTGSIRGVLLQIVCVSVGVCIYYPFFKIHEKVERILAAERMKSLFSAFQEMEEEGEIPKFLMQTDQKGVVARMMLEDLKYAIRHRQLFLLYQPQIDDTGHCFGAEALLRWNHPTYGFIYPPFIIYLAKEGGVLQDLERLIFDLAGEAIQNVTQEYKGEFKVSVNITAKSLYWDIEECIEECLEKYHIPAEKLWLEITEQDVIANSNNVIDKLSRLKAVGHTLLIDDFGMGHTSLIYLQSNYFNVVKLDGSLVKKILQSNTNQKIVESIVKLGKELDVDVIAEYVETQEQVEMLKELGCKRYQGYLFSKPVSIEECIKCLKEHNE